jgi:hypothetical protein
MLRHALADGLWSSFSPHLVSEYLGVNSRHSSIALPCLNTTRMDLCQERSLLLPLSFFSLPARLITLVGLAAHQQHIL